MCISLPRSKMNVASDFVVDLNKPLVFQVGHLGKAYQEWVHKPIVSHDSPRFFESDLLEFLSCTRWWVVPMIWLPVVCWFASKSARMGCSFSHIALILAFGIFVWSFLEYIFHRFVFHIETESYWGNTFHYVSHGCHHKHPMDKLRLVFPPVVGVILCIPLWHILKHLSTPSTTPALFAGIVFGYLSYDVIHYYAHHGQPSGNIRKKIKKNHMNHHFRIHAKSYGITSSLWDKVFGTLPQPKFA